MFFDARYEMMQFTHPCYEVSRGDALLAVGRVDTIRDEIRYEMLFFYRTETTNRKWKTEKKLKSKNGCAEKYR